MIQYAVFLLFLVAQTALGQGPEQENPKSFYSELGVGYSALKENAKSQFAEGKWVVTATATITHKPTDTTWIQPLSTVVTATPGWDADWPRWKISLRVETSAMQSGIDFESSSFATVTSASDTNWPHQSATATSTAQYKHHDPLKRHFSGEDQIMNNKPHFNGSATYQQRRWVAPIYFGTPPVAILVELNTGSSDFWVYPAGSDWALQEGYNASNSSTHIVHTGHKFKSTDQGGKVSGDVFEDTLHLRLEKWNGQNLEPIADDQVLPNCTFGVPSKADHVSAIIAPMYRSNYSDSDYTSSYDEDDAYQAKIEANEESENRKQMNGTYGSMYVDGMLGLGMARLNDKGPTKFLPWLARTYNITLFTLALRGTSQSTIGYFGFGFIDEKQTNGTISYIPAHRVSYRNFGPAWGVMMTSFEVLGSQQPPTETNVQVVVDSGTENILLPKNLVQDYYSHVKGASYNETRKQWCFPCGAQIPEIGFELKGEYEGKLTSLVLGDHDLVYMPDGYEEPNLPYDDYKDPSVCAGRVQEVEKGGQAIFGLPFFSSRFLVFDLRSEKIGITGSIDPYVQSGYYNAYM